ncbi:hypothetical protein [Staphylococcus hyicus]|uniref:Uncharacterized protein n=1 Tax=Staphylococcus hyicus TaxID=1284 RepID=A0ACD5FKM5_STAHY|nr:hypothetical protein [Staphylococcus hyicus]MDP4447471.1 hypothetical protein [Staphylococcus hyicus]MDP4460384.1 hypothetical protein [Staphylococcus hyicus]MDP4464454.1 hypothetical protein [Staphylococcus hyicus]
MSDKKSNNKNGCLGCLAFFILFALILTSCNVLFTNDEDEQKNDNKKQSQVDEQSKNQEDDKKKSGPEDNTVYGKLTKKHQNNSVAVIEDVTYTLGENDKILQAEKDFSDLPLDKNTDKNFLNEHAKDLMAKDAEFVSNTSDTEQKYHSKSLNKDYYVTLTLDDNGKVRSLIVSSFK